MGKGAAGRGQSQGWSRNRSQVNTTTLGRATTARGNAEVGSGLYRASIEWQTGGLEQLHLVSPGHATVARVNNNLCVVSGPNTGQCGHGSPSQGNVNTKEAAQKL